MHQPIDDKPIERANQDAIETKVECPRCTPKCFVCGGTGVCTVADRNAYTGGIAAGLHRKPSQPGMPAVDPRRDDDE